MKLNPDQLEAIRQRLAYPVSHTLHTTLGDYLERVYPNAEIAVLMGYNASDDCGFNQGAFFDLNEARVTLLQLRSNGSPELKNEYHILKGTIEDLTEGRMVDEMTGKALGDSDKKMIYASLQVEFSASKASDKLDMSVTSSIHKMDQYIKMHSDN